MNHRFMGRGAVSDRHHPSQLELFPDVPMPPKARQGLIAGLAVHLDRHCGCGATIALITEGKGPHAAALECPNCCRFRQWVPRTVLQFLVELIARCGRPTDPIKIYEQVNRVRQLPDGAALDMTPRARSLSNEY